MLLSCAQVCQLKSGDTNMLASVGIPVDCLHKRVGQHPIKSAATVKSVARDIIFNVCEYTFTDPIISQKVSVSANIFLSSNHKIGGNQNQEVTISVFNCWRLWAFFGLVSQNWFWLACQVAGESKIRVQSSHRHHKPMERVSFKNSNITIPYHACLT